MKSLLRSRNMSEECEAATFEAALYLAHQKYGSEALLRCWKVRRGGVFGFFAKESFVAGLTQPAGANRRGSQKPPTRDDGANLLSELVEGTRDEVSIGASPEAMFQEVLAEAEAVLINAAANAGTTSHPLVEERPTDSSARIDGLRAQMSNLGVAADYLPDESETLDALVRALAALPKAPAVVKVEGSVLVVVGSRRDALFTAQHIAASLELSDADVIIGEPINSVRQKVIRRRAGKKMTVLVVEAPVSRRDLAPVVTWLDQIEPDYVLGAVPATAKPGQVQRWHGQLGRIDALALSRLEGAPAMGALMGVLPIAFLDGAPATALRWVSVLIHSMLEARP